MSLFYHNSHLNPAMLLIENPLEMQWFWLAKVFHWECVESRKALPTMWGLICQNFRGEEKELVGFVHHESLINEKTQKVFYVGASNPDPNVYRAIT